MNELLYEKKVECPVCDHHFSTIAVKKKAYKVERRDSDFRSYYKEIDPLYYDVWICSKCGYAALQNHFLTITTKRAGFVKEWITPRWVERELNKEVDINGALERYKLALITAQITKAKAGELGIICLKIAWLYREKESLEKENEFLQHALEMLLQAFNSERPPIEGMDEYTVMYLIGELYRRVGNSEEAALWMSKIISTRNASSLIMNMAKEQWQIIKQEIKKE